MFSLKSITYLFSGYLTLYNYQVWILYHEVCLNKKVVVISITFMPILHPHFIYIGHCFYWMVWCWGLSFSSNIIFKTMNDSKLGKRFHLGTSLTCSISKCCFLFFITINLWRKNNSLSLSSTSNYPLLIFL